MGLDRVSKTSVPGRMHAGIPLQTPFRPHPFSVSTVVIVPLNHALDFSPCALSPVAWAGVLGAVP